MAAAFASLRAADGMLFTGSPPFLIHFLVPLRFLWRGRLDLPHHRFPSGVPDRGAGAPVSAGSAVLLALTNFWRRRMDRLRGAGGGPAAATSRRPACGTNAIALVRDGSPVSFTGDETPEPRPAELAGSLRAALLGQFRHRPRGRDRRRGLWLSPSGRLGTRAAVAECDRQWRHRPGPPSHRAGPSVPCLEAGTARKAGRSPAGSRRPPRDAEGCVRRLRDAVQDLCLCRVPAGLSCSSAVPTPTSTSFPAMRERPIGALRAETSAALPMRWRPSPIAAKWRRTTLGRRGSSRRSGRCCAGRTGPARALKRNRKCRRTNVTIKPHFLR